MLRGVSVRRRGREVGVRVVGFGRWSVGFGWLGSDEMGVWKGDGEMRNGWGTTGVKKFRLIRVGIWRYVRLVCWYMAAFCSSPRRGHRSYVFHPLHLDVPGLFKLVLFVQQDDALSRSAELHAVASYGDGDRSLRGARADEHTNARDVHGSKSKATPDASFHDGLLPLKAGDDIVRGLVLVGPDGLDDVGAGVLAVCCVEEEFEDEKTRAGRDEGVQEQCVCEKTYQCSVAL